MQPSVQLLTLKLCPVFKKTSSQLLTTPSKEDSESRIFNQPASKPTGYFVIKLKIDKHLSFDKLFLKELATDRLKERTQWDSENYFELFEENFYLLQYDQGAYFRLISVPIRPIKKGTGHQVLSSKLLITESTHSL